MNNKKRKYSKTTKELQLLVLKEMLSAKDILFGKFCGTKTTKADIQSEWSRIARLAASYGLLTEDDGEKFRKTTWQNWRRNAMAKIDRIKKTGAGGAGAEDLLDEIDKIILAIVGEKVAFGIGCPESNGDKNDNAGPSAKQPMLAQLPPQPSSSSQSRSSSLRDKLLDVTYYLKTLECREKEIMLNLPPSKFTTDIGVNLLSSDDEVDDK